jgi:hypothetical protein
MPTPRHGIQAATCNGGIYIAAGGKSPGGGNATDVLEVLFPGGTATTCSGTTPPPGDTTAPSVVSTVPAAGASSVAVGSNVSAVFSEEMLAGSISGSTVKLTAANSTTAIAAAVSYDATAKQVTLEPVGRSGGGHPVHRDDCRRVRRRQGRGGQRAGPGQDVVVHDRVGF